VSLVACEGYFFLDSLRREIRMVVVVGPSRSDIPWPRYGDLRAQFP
jgi:hypothetical protein